MSSTFVSALGALLEVALVNLVLSGDNAVVIGLAARGLRPDLAKRAVFIGGLSAVLLRLALTVPAELLLQIPLLRAAGGCLLAWIAYRLLAADESGPEGTGASSIGTAVRLIVLADVSMSLDNVLAVAAVAERSAYPVLVLTVGIALSVPIVLVGGRVVASLMSRLPWLAWAGAAVLSFTAAELIVEDKAVEALIELPALSRYGLAVLFALAVLAVAWRSVRLTRKEPA